MKLLVYGSSEYGAVLRDLVASCGHDFAGFIDDVHPHRDGVLGDFESVSRSARARDHGAVLAIGYRHLEARRRAFAALRAAGFALPALVHPQAYVHGSARVGDGSVVMARAIVDRGAALGEACVLWPGANVSHDSRVGANTFLSPGSIVCGLAMVGASCFVGAGAVIADHVDVPDGSFVKAGSVFGGTPAAK